MKCQVPQCSGHSSELFCGDHGELCSECGIPTIWFTEDKRCAKCRARAEGIVCHLCTSPWIHTITYEDQKWICRPCMHNLITQNGWDKDGEEILAMLKQIELDRQADDQARQERQQTAGELFAKSSGYLQRKRATQEESLFE